MNNGIRCSGQVLWMNKGRIPKNVFKAKLKLKCLHERKTKIKTETLGRETRYAEKRKNMGGKLVERRLLGRQTWGISNGRLYVLCLYRGGFPHAPRPLYVPYRYSNSRHAHTLGQPASSTYQRTAELTPLAVAWSTSLDGQYHNQFGSVAPFGNVGFFNVH
jgi:hypothetical protein